MGGRVPWEQLCRIAARPGRLHDAVWILGRPAAVEWPAPGPELTSARREVAARLPEPARVLADLALLADGLLSSVVEGCEGAGRAAWADWAAGDLPWEELLPGVPREEAVAAPWTAVPVLGVFAGDSCAVWFAAGILPRGAGAPLTRPLPPWAWKALDSAAQAAVSDAASAALGQHPGASGVPYAFPLFLGPLRDRSLGLPLALGWVSALGGGTLSPHVAATGRLSPSGRIEPVDPHTLSQKAECARTEGFALLLVPDPNGAGFVPGPGVEVKPVSGLDQAAFWASLYTPGGFRQLDIFEDAVEDDGVFARTCACLHPDYVAWYGATPRAREQVQKICRSARLAPRLVEQLEEALDEESWEPERAEALAALLPPGAALEELAHTSPLAAFRWCSLNALLAHRTGRRSDEDAWDDLAERLAPAAAEADEESYFAHLVRRLEYRFHGRFHFFPALPPELGEALTRREAARAHRRSADRTLGFLCSAAARHFGYCGPEHLPTTLDYLGRARKALGEGRVRELDAPWRRTFADETAARIDAGDLAGAEAALLRYLALDAWDALGPPSDLSPFQQYLLVRFLADAVVVGNRDGLPVETVFGAVCEQLALYPHPPTSGGVHPWQLWAYNAGRLTAALGDLETAGRAWRLSAELCQCPEASETVRPMTLLPLAALHGSGRLGDEGYVLAEELRRWIDGSDYLGRGHLAGLMAARSVRTKLWLVETFFPFNYR